VYVSASGRTSKQRFVSASCTDNRFESVEYEDEMNMITLVRDDTLLLYDNHNGALLKQVNLEPLLDSRDETTSHRVILDKTTIVDLGSNDKRCFVTAYELSRNSEEHALPNRVHNHGADIHNDIDNDDEEIVLKRKNSR